MTHFNLQPSEEELQKFAEKYVRDKSEIDKEQAAFDAGGRILRHEVTVENIKEEIKKIVYWKSPRVVHHIDSNSPEKILEVLEKAIARKANIREAIEVLKGLNGVGVPVASAILTAIFPSQYTIIDFRVLEALGCEVSEVDFYERYLIYCRNLASDLTQKKAIHKQEGYPAPTELRALDRALWQWSRSKGILTSE